MNADRYAGLIVAADRMWSLTWELERIRGDYALTDWVAAKVHSMIRDGTSADPEHVIKLADALERRLSLEVAA